MPHSQIHTVLKREANVYTNHKMCVYDIVRYGLQHITMEALNDVIAFYLIFLSLPSVHWVCWSAMPSRISHSDTQLPLVSSLSRTDFICEPAIAWTHARNDIAHTNTHVHRMYTAKTAWRRDLLEVEVSRDGFMLSHEHIAMENVCIYIYIYIYMEVTRKYT